ncbi:L,D-transpeptidase family protein [Schlegelella sp. S2-27]|uniref:L,D-transpeptidase family protein n=1 Tax=Caldimonas mangrovi TaxID=2944811 RepID=A0ABT0YQS3_9BURK|nr:L,D-transpeptidase family protein [Caldimonas mangrovi]MCM5681084.1 L,D-transpeptidase family protein [Caldimonas mangrovi]
MLHQPDRLSARPWPLLPAFALALAVTLLACSERRSQPHATAPDAATETTRKDDGPSFVSALRQRVADPSSPQAVRRLYAERSPLWLDVRSRPGPQAEAALALLRAAHTEGLDPAVYRADALALQARQIATERPDDAVLADFEFELSQAVLRYLRHLHAGRVQPKAVGFRVPARDEATDIADVLRVALRQGRLADAVEALQPKLAQYPLLRGELARYRSLAAQPALQEPLPGTDSVRPGDSYPALAALHARLVAYGDLPPSAAVPAERYDGEIVEGVKRFQARHGLEADGVLGRSTQSALNVPPQQRVRQIELAMERLRWLPELGRQPFIGINIPMYRLWASDAASSGPVAAATMNVVVGKALDTQTPVMMEEMRYLIFRPYWNVPRSIVLGEILPKLQQDPAYLDKQQMEIVDGPGDDAKPVATTPKSLEALTEGKLRLRQRPGTHNSLGLVKFIFPNDEAVYLHGTTAQGLFDRIRRDFSHGCVRVEDPVALAQWVLKDQPEWTREKVVGAMQGQANSVRVDLKRPVQVLLFYVTAVVMPEDGRMHFAADIYKHDARLERALAQRAPG